MNLLEREVEIREAIEENLSETITQDNVLAIHEYLSLDTVSEREKLSAIRNMQEIVFEQRLFSHMRTMFATREGEGYRFTPGSELL